MRPILIKASSEDSQDITATCQIVDANVALPGRAVRVQTIYHKEDVVAVRHDRRREISPFWLAVLLEDVQVEVHDGKFLRQKVALQWLNQTSDPLTYTPGDTCNRNSPKCILTRVVGYTEDANITLSSEEDTRLCRLANGDLSYDEDVEDTEDAEVFVDTAAEPTEYEREVSLLRLPGVSLSGRRTTHFFTR